MTVKAKMEMQRALGYIEGVADTLAGMTAGPLIMETVRVIDDILKKEAQADEVD